MSIYQQLKAAQIEARKASIKLPTSAWRSSLLTTLLGEIEREVTGTLSPDERTAEAWDRTSVVLIKRFVNRNKEVPEAVRTLKHELELGELNEYLPKQFTKDYLIGLLIHQFKPTTGTETPKLGPMMGWLKANYEGQYDGGVAKEAAQYVAAQ